MVYSPNNKHEQNLPPVHDAMPLHERVSISSVTERISQRLPALAAELVAGTQDMTDPENQSFAASPDDPREHAPCWHQFGVLTHSEEFNLRLQTTVPALLEQWGVTIPANEVLAEEIDGTPKSELLPAAALLHDIGKFTARKLKRGGDGVVSASYEDHEEHSGEIIRGHELSTALKGWGLTEAQVEYIARCAELHFELGKVRRVAGENGGYNVKFTETEAFASAAQAVIDEHPGYALEIGLEFIADSLSKTEVAAVSQTDEAILLEKPALEAEIISRGLNPKLINQALQMPVNVKVAEIYLRQWAAQRQALSTPLAPNTDSNRSSSIREADVATTDHELTDEDIDRYAVSGLAGLPWLHDQIRGAGGGSPNLAMLVSSAFPNDPTTARIVTQRMVQLINDGPDALEQRRHELFGTRES